MAAVLVSAETVVLLMVPRLATTVPKMAEQDELHSTWLLIHLLSLRIECQELLSHVLGSVVLTSVLLFVVMGSVCFPSLHCL